MSRLGRWIDRAFALPVMLVRLVSAAALITLLGAIALLVLPPLHWILAAWHFAVRRDLDQSQRYEQLPQQAWAWIRERVDAVLGRPPSRND